MTMSLILLPLLPLILVSPILRPPLFQIWLAILIQGPVMAIFSPKGGDWPDFAVLLILQIVNGMVGWYEGVKAGNAVAALKESLGTSAYVRRNGMWTTGM